MPRGGTSAKKRKMAADTPNDKVTLVVDGKHISASRSKLKNASDYFSAMFSSGMTESHEEEVDIQQVDEDCLQTLVDYSLSGTLNLTVETVESLLAAAVYLQFRKVVAECCELLKTNFSARNCLRIRNIASGHFLPDLEKAAQSYALANFLDVVKTDDFRQLSAKDLTVFLQSEILKVNTEDDVYEALVLWLDSNKSVPDDVLVNLVQTVRLPFLSPEVIEKAYGNPAFKSVKENLDKIKSGSGESGWKQRKTTTGILIAIGLDGPHIWDEYDPVEESWKTVGSVDGLLEGGRHVLVDEILYYVGGACQSYLEAKTDFQYLNFSEEKWYDGPKLLQGRNNNGAAWMDGALYAVGGQHAHKEQILKDVELWRPDTNKWQKVASMPEPKAWFGETVNGNKMYVVGGLDENYRSTGSVFCFDGQRNQWLTCPPLNLTRSDVGVGLLDGVIYTAGGNAEGQPARRSAALERFDPRIGKWEILPEMMTPRSQPAVASFAQELFVVGGHTNERRVGIVEIFDPSAAKWRKGSSLESCPEDLQMFKLPPNSTFFRKQIP